jgi:hypothetical protein
MKSLRDYINIVEGTALLENPWQATDPAKAAAWAALSPEDQKFLGNADPTDTAILARAPNKGKPAAPAAAPPAPAAGAPNPDQPAASDTGEVPGVTVQSGATPQTAAPAASDTGEVPGVTVQSGATPQTAASDTGEVPGVTVQSGATPQTAAPANRDAMPFGRAFADAKAKGEKEFTWKGKKYAVTTAKPAAPAQQAATPAAQPGMWDKFKNWATAGGKPAQAVSGAQISDTPAAESVESKSDAHLKELDDIRRIAGLNK